MNQLIFFSHILICITGVLFSLRLGVVALTTAVCLQGILANLFVVKQISLFSFTVTCSDVFTIGCILSLNLLQEYFGKKAAKRALKLSLFSLLFFLCLAKIHLLYIPSSSDVTHDAFATIFSHSSRIILASIVTFFIVQLWDVHFFGWLKGMLPIRVGISLVFSQLLDTVLFSFLGLYGIVESVFDIIFVSFFIKCLIICISAPFTAFSKGFVKNEIQV